jgi:hypothetical protein
MQKDNEVKSCQRHKEIVDIVERKLRCYAAAGTPY